MEELGTEPVTIETGEENNAATMASSAVKETPQSQPEEKVSQIST